MPKNRDNDAEKSIVINLGDEDFEITPRNATLFTFLGQNALYNHVFIQTGQEEEGRIAGTYLFSDIDGFPKLRKLMRQLHFPAVLDMPDVAECDMEAFDLHVHHMTEDLELGVPEGWE